jgi:hypothetical protein
MMMSDVSNEDPRSNDEDPQLAGGSGALTPDDRDGGHDPLPKPIQEHLGRQLRSTYNAEADRPAFLGDPAIPPQFERLIRRIEIGEKVHEFGVEAVRQALQADPIVTHTQVSGPEIDPNKQE